MIERILIENRNTTTIVITKANERERKTYKEVMRT